MPTYHLIVEVLLVEYILRLLLSKTSDKSKEVKLTKEVCTVCVCVRVRVRVRVRVCV